MGPMEIKEYGLRFIIDKDIKIKVGTSVSLKNETPLSPDDFYWIESIKYEPTGFMYSVYGLDTSFHESELYQLLPILVSDERLIIHDKFYHNGKIYDCMDLVCDCEDGEGNWFVLNELGESILESEVSKVIATPDMFGWLYNEGPLHDHNMVWQDSRYLEDYKQSCLISAVKNGLKMTVIVHEVCPNYNGSHLDKDCSCKSGFVHGPKLHEGKIIIDAYGILRNSSSVIIF